MKAYLKLTIVDHTGRTFTQPLKMSEARLISQIAKENKSVLVEYMTASPNAYKQMFG